VISTGENFTVPRDDGADQRIGTRATLGFACLGDRLRHQTFMLVAL
jgi:hypothetical protein